MKETKIALCGSQSVGKSTVINALKQKEELKYYVFIDEIVRKLVREENVKIDKNSTHDSQMRILEEHYKNIWKYRNFISDRCALDAFVYATWDYVHGKFTYAEHKIHESVFLDCIKSYDYIFYIPIEFDIVPDGFRNTQKDYQREIDELFVKVIQKYNIKSNKLTGTCENRVRQFCEALK
jgi:nicotinamide riboside kinase